MKKDLSFSKRIGLFLATGFGSGLFPIAPGTVGTAVAIPLVILSGIVLYPWVYISVFCLFTLVGVWASFIGEAYYDKKDPGPVNIDEIAGFFVCMFLVPITIQTVITGFFVFRIFDILKPPPARLVEKLPGGWGIMIDDLIAGLYSLLVMHILINLFPGLRL